MKFATQTRSRAMSVIISTRRVTKILSENRRESKLILVDGVQDPGNLGAIIRLQRLLLILIKCYYRNQVVILGRTKCIRGAGVAKVVSLLSHVKKKIFVTFLKLSPGERIALSANNGDSIYKKMAFADKTLF